MALKVDICHTHILSRLILLHGIEITLGHVILIGEVEVPTTHLIAGATSDTMRILPVHIVGGRRIRYARIWALHTMRTCCV